MKKIVTFYSECVEVSDCIVTSEAVLGCQAWRDAFNIKYWGGGGGVN
jgi:hypothetical protein